MNVLQIDQRPLSLDVSLSPAAREFLSPGEAYSMALEEFQKLRSGALTQELKCSMIVNHRRADGTIFELTLNRATRIVQIRTHSERLLKGF
jgi:hypothetical protein